VGSVSIVPLPSEGEFDSYNRRVAANNGWDRDEKSETGERPLVFSGSHPIKHVIYVIKENRTYDQVLGDMPAGNGDPSLAQFGALVSPNHHELAEQFGLDGYLVDSSSPNVLWYPVWSKKITPEPWRIWRQDSAPSRRVENT
jgi:phospholipase C